MVKQILGLFIEPVSRIFEKREERKTVQKQIDGKLAQAKIDGEQQVTFNDQELEQLMVQQKANSWVDEYASVSVLSILNLIVIGGIAAAFGETRMLEGMGYAIMALAGSGVNIGFLLEAVVMAAIGLTVWRKL